ncbi:hypothetical protein ABZ330_07670 [Streptomyces sp. NPDC006172]|uniref:hypothetical protein n=1 Tax=Streptomyces sp. NPDC006172 TaxID=3154470 RepID=UPI0033EFE1CF
MTHDDTPRGRGSSGRDDTAAPASGPGAGYSGAVVQLALPRAARTVSVTGTGGLVLAIAKGWFVDNTAGLCAVVVLVIAGMAYDLADRALRRR